MARIENDPNFEAKPDFLGPAFEPLHQLLIAAKPELTPEAAAERLWYPGGLTMRPRSSTGRSNKRQTGELLKGEPRRMMDLTLTRLMSRSCQKWQRGKTTRRRSPKWSSGTKMCRSGTR